MRVGLPHALLHWTYAPLWLTFFAEIGVEVTLSGETTRGTLDAGVRLAVDEACLPVKVFYGHCAELLGHVDQIFIPRLVSVERRAYICPKFMGLPDMIQQALGGRVGLLSPLVDLRLGGSLMGAAAPTARALGVTDRRITERALERAVKAQREARRRWESGSLPSGAAAGRGEPDPFRTLGVLGHPYNIYDRLVSMNVLERLSAAGWSLVTPETVPTAECASGAATLRKELFWTLGRRVYGAAASLIQRRTVAGLLHLVSFGCGPDSLVGELVARLADRSHVPFLLLTLDEHTGEAGALTRLEAFLDMLERRKEVAPRPG